MFARQRHQNYARCVTADRDLSGPDVVSETFRKHNIHASHGLLGGDGPHALHAQLRLKRAAHFMDGLLVERGPIGHFERHCTGPADGGDTVCQLSPGVT